VRWCAATKPKLLPTKPQATVLERRLFDLATHLTKEELTSKLDAESTGLDIASRWLHTQKKARLIDYAANA
jgi:hypothetical protein